MNEVISWLLVIVVGGFYLLFVGTLVVWALGGVLVVILFLWERHWFLRPDLPHRKINDSDARARKHRREEISRCAIQYEEWMVDLERRVQQIPAARFELQQRGSIGGAVLIRVLDPGGASTLYKARDSSKGWWIWLAEVEFPPANDNRISDIVESARRDDHSCPWVVFISGAFGHQVFIEPIDYEAAFLDEDELSEPNFSK